MAGRRDTDETPELALRERGIIVRASAATLATANSVLLVVAMIDPGAFGLSVTMVLVLGVPHVAVEIVVAVLPWQRILPQRPRPWLLRGHVALNLVGLLVALVVADASAEALWLVGLLLVYSALILPSREHAAVTAVAVAGAGATTVLSSGLSLTLVVQLTAVTGIGVLAAIGSAVVWSALVRAERARTEADESAAALHDALVAVHATSTGDVPRILQSTAVAAVRGPYDMASVVLVDEQGEVTSAFHRVPEELRVDDPVAVQAMVDRIAEQGSAVMDYEGPDAALLPEGMRGQLRASMVAPIRMHGAVIGAVTASRRRGRVFTSGERAALELLADHVARGAALSRELEADREALARLRELNRMKRDFVATVSHEMRTPLTVITGLSETLELHGDRLDTEDHAQLVGRLRSNAATLERIVTGLLDAAGIDRGLVAVAEEGVDLSRLLEATGNRLVPLFDQHTLLLDVPPGLGCRGDASLLERVLENLLTNAERHTPPGTTVRLAAHRIGQRVRVEVTDDGPGIPPEELEHVLGRFVRGGHHNDRPTRGLGLGLALSDEVLRLHDSQLEVDSTVGQGTTFHFTLPAPALTGGTERSLSSARAG